MSVKTPGQETIRALLIEDQSTSTDGSNSNASDTTPLLSDQESFLPPATQSSHDSKLRRKLVIMSVLFISVIEISQLIMEAPFQQIIEEVVCHHHTYAIPGSSAIEDCKSTSVQKTLAMIRSWSYSCETFVPLFTQIPYGIIADKRGRKPVLLASLVGICLSTLWQFIVLANPNTFNIWTMLLGNLGYLIGGGPQLALAIIYTMLTDVVPARDRGRLFYTLYAVMILLSIVFHPVSAFLLSIDPWLPMWLSFALLVVGTLMATLVPETLGAMYSHTVGGIKVVRLEPGQTDEPYIPSNSSKTKSPTPFLASVYKILEQTCRSVFVSRPIMTLVLANGIFFPLKVTFVITMLQYMTKRFDIAWSTAAYFLTAGNVASALSLLILIPLISSWLVRRFNLHPVSRDLVLARGFIILVTIGSLMAAFANNVPALVGAVAIASVGSGFGTICRALLTSIVEPQSVATLNTSMAFVENLAGLFGIPLFGWLQGKGVEYGGLWMGLPYMAVTVGAAMVTMIVFMFRVPDGIIDAHDNRSHEA